MFLLPIKLDRVSFETKGRQNLQKTADFLIESIVFCPLVPPSWISLVDPTSAMYASAIYVSYIYGLSISRNLVARARDYFTRSVRQFQFPECKQYAVRTSVSVVSVLYLDRCTASINLKTNNHESDESMILKTAVRTAVSAIR